MGMFKFLMMLLVASASALVITPRAAPAASVRTSTVVMGAKKVAKSEGSAWSLSDILSAPLGGRELLNGSAPDRPAPQTPEQYDRRSIKLPKVEKSGKINPKDASTW